MRLPYLISEEFAGIVRDSTLSVNEIPSLLNELLNGNGIKGVELTQLSHDSFTLNLTAAGITDTIVFQGSDISLAIANANTGSIDIKNGNRHRNDFGIFNTDNSGQFTLGGGARDKTLLVSPEFGDLVGGSKLSRNRIQPLLNELITGNGINNVDLIGLSKDTFTIQINPQSGATDTILFEGETAKDAITGLTSSSINIRDRRNQLGLFQFDSTDARNESFTLGGRASDKSLISESFNDIVEGSNLQESEVEALFLGARDNSIRNVTLLSGTSATHFTVALDIAGGTRDIITVIDTGI